MRYDRIGAKVRNLNATFICPRDVLFHFNPSGGSKFSCNIDQRYHQTLGGQVQQPGRGTSVTVPSGCCSTPCGTIVLKNSPVGLKMQSPQDPSWFTCVI